MKFVNDNIMQSIIWYVLYLKMLITNCMKYIWQKICTTRSVLAIQGDTIVSVYCRYIMLSFINLCKCIMLKRMYDWCCKYFDIDADAVQVVVNVDYVDRYIVYENKDNKMAISNAIKHMCVHKNKIQVIDMQPCVLSCQLKMLERETVDIKDLIRKYSTEKFPNYTIKRMLDFNKIKYDNNTIMEVVLFMLQLGGRKVLTFKMDEILNKRFNEIL